MAIAHVSLSGRTNFMSFNLTRSGSCALILFLGLVLELTRCGLPPVTGDAAEVRPGIIIIEGNTKQGFPYLFGGASSNEREAMEERAKDYKSEVGFCRKKRALSVRCYAYSIESETRRDSRRGHARSVVLYSIAGGNLRYQGGFQRSNKADQEF